MPPFTGNARADAAILLLQSGESANDAATLAAASLAGVDALLRLFAGSALDIGKTGSPDVPKSKVLPKEKKE